MENTNKQDYSIERKIIARATFATSLAILSYLIHGLYSKNDLVFVQASIALVLYVLIGYTSYKILKFPIGKWLFLGFAITSIVFGFFSLGGFFGITCIDFVNFTILLALLLKGKERNFTFSLFALLLMVLVYIHISHFELITNSSENDPIWLNVINYFIRIALAFNMSIAIGDAYARENSSINNLLDKIKGLYEDLAEQKEDLLSAQEQLTSSNNNLELMVQERTKALEDQKEVLLTYAYINSHVFRAPMCRIKGLTQLIDITTNNEEKLAYVELVTKEVQAMDKVVEKIALILNDSDPDFLSDLKDKAKKLGYQENE